MKNKIKLLMLLAIAIAFESCDDDVQLDVKACFTYSPEQNIQVGDTVFFSNCSEDAISYTWSFGDGESSNEVDPFHVYTEPGVYDVGLYAHNGAFNVLFSAKVSVDADLSYVINYGSYSGAKSTITAYDKYSDNIIPHYYNEVNGVYMVSNVQYAYNYNGNIYFMGNNPDGVFYVNNKSFEQTTNAITTDIIKPRYCVAEGDYLYVSCWGGDIWADENVSYIAKLNLTNNTVEKKIALPGGPEGLAIAKNKLYAALNYKDSVAVIDIASETISYIETPAVSSFFIKDESNNLYVSLVSTYNDYSEDTGIGYINTSTDVLEASYKLTGVSTSYVNILSANSDFSKLYVMTSAYDADWNLSGAVAAFDVNSKSFDTNNLVEGVSGLNGIGFYNNQVLCFVSESTTNPGTMHFYEQDGTKAKEEFVGISPFMLLTVD